MSSNAAIIHRLCEAGRHSRAHGWLPANACRARLRTNLLAALLLAALYATGCAAKAPQQLTVPASSNNSVVIREIGMTVHTVQGSLVVRSVVPYLPAMVAGIAPKDVIFKVDGQPRTHRELVELLMAKQPGETVLFMVRRKNDVLKFEVSPMEKTAPPTMIAMRRIMSSEQRVRLAVITGRISSTVPATSESWEDIMRTMLQGSSEDRFRDQFGEDQGLVIIDRIILGPLVLQHRITKTGEMPADACRRISDATRATHLLLVNHTRVPAAGQCLDRTDATLIDGESCAMLATDRNEVPACEGGAGAP